MDPLLLLEFGNSGQDAQLEVTAPNHSLIFLFVLDLSIYESNTLPPLLAVSIQKIAGTRTTGVLLFRNGMHWSDCMFENYAVLHLDIMSWLSQKLHFVISIFRHFLSFMFRFQLFCRSEKQNKKKKICF